MVARYSSFQGDNISYSGWLVVDSQGHMRLSREEPTVKPHERKIKLGVAVPKSVFKQPELSVQLAFTGENAPISKAAIKKAVATAVQGLGLEVRVEGLAPGA